MREARRWVIRSLAATCARRYLKYDVERMAFDDGRLTNDDVDP
jgi:hypothetical protein